MHGDVIDDEACHLETRGPGRQPEVERQDNDIRRIQTADASLPERPKANVRFVSGRTRASPLHMNTETGNYEEEKDSDVALRNSKLDQPNGILKQVIWRRLLVLVSKVIENNK